MRYLIVNADDFGASHGINRGIVETHQRGILTSTSLLVDTPWSQDAASLAHTAPDLSVGLHVHLRSTAIAAGDRDGDSCRGSRGNPVEIPVGSPINIAQPLRRSPSRRTSRSRKGSYICIHPRCSVSTCGSHA